MTQEYKYKIFNQHSGDFDQLALEAFHFQYQHNPIYRLYTDSLSIDTAKVQNVAAIPFLPVGVFKSHTITTTNFEPAVIFTSSGTTQTINSRHLVKEPDLYRQSFLQGFNRFYGPVSDWCIIGLLPAYLERTGSSLVWMVEELVKVSNHPNSGFYLYNYSELNDLLTQLEKAGQQTLLIGVTFALLDFAEQFPQQLKHTVVMETGGMKGRRREMIREELHTVLCEGLGVSAIHSEYGMTELLSQAYSPGGGIFHCCDTMRVLVRNEEDPFDIATAGTGVLNIIDLANIYSCAFIATDDVGTVYADGSFEVRGRLDNSDLRGCSLMVV
jgi:Acyl-protein synthetase, LuxE